MIYSRFGISFQMMKEDDIEIVRQWRNDPVVVNNYEFRDYITPEMQMEWFRRVNNINNLYTIVWYKGERIGVINMKNIDWESRYCEGGIFLPDPRHHEGVISGTISFMTTELIFTMFDWHSLSAHVLKENRAVQAFVSMLGYVKAPGQENENNQLFIITRESYEKRAPKLRKAVSVLIGNSEKGILQIEPGEFNDPLICQWEDVVRKSPFISRVETTPGGRYYYFA